MANLYKKCPRCAQPAVMEMQQCQRCGHVYRTVPPERTQFFEGQVPHFVPEPASANITLIVWMWSLTIMVVILSVTVGFGAAALVDIPSLVLAIILACSKHRTDKINGWVKIGLEVVGFLIGFVLGAQQGMRGGRYY